MASKGNCSLISFKLHLITYLVLNVTYVHNTHHIKTIIRGTTPIIARKIGEQGRTETRFPRFPLRPTLAPCLSGTP